MAANNMATEQLMDHRRNQRKNKTEYLETYENESTMAQTYQIQQKQY